MHNILNNLPRSLILINFHLEERLRCGEGWGLQFVRRCLRHVSIVRVNSHIQRDAYKNPNEMTGKPLTYTVEIEGNMLRMTIVNPCSRG